MANYKLFSTILLTIGSVAGVREYLKPRDIQSMLKWNGIRLISNDDGWKSAFYEKESKLREINVHSANGLWKWCSERFKYGLGDSSILDSVQEYCQDNPTTIMGNIIRSGEEKRFIKDTDATAFQIAYAISGDREQLMEVMGIKVPEERKNQFNYMGAEVSKWCIAQKNEKVKDAKHLGNVKKYCYNKNVRKVRDLIKKEGLKQMMTTAEYADRFTKELNNATDLIKSLQHRVETIRATMEKDIKDRQTKFGHPEEWLTRQNDELEKLIPKNLDEAAIRKNSGQYLKWWCEGQFDDDLNSNIVFPNSYAKVKARCTVKK
ncbi:hypothetical protein A6V39_04475 [Candidatus Mycoplasma haematobovis]|uniref:Uncharacterized protein n=1 Tax=Candidatus Mycoplasma haematobovis TaxID=432608 RepID=A0A1A9QEN1_9MOLU|nr:hypothetical protein [Candidatus Mycoplasma haematobovis]OAL10140.1 hypothetical protein A6V39_04475 [Candidatus Mycoplasma haematobovis]